MNLTSVILNLCISFSLISEMKLKANSDEFLILNDNLLFGFGAELGAVLGALDYYEKGNYAGLEVVYDTGLYLDPLPAEQNWWNCYFEPIHLGNASNQDKYYFSYKESLSILRSAYNSSRERNAELIQRYIQVKPEIEAAVDSYINKHFSGCYVIGVHHRGTDKSLEAKILDYSESKKAVRAIMKTLSNAEKKNVKIYVATDDQFFLDYMIKKFGSTVIYNKFTRSKNDKPLHYGQNLYPNNYEKGREAIVDALILSRTSILIRPSASSFSWMSTCFNPNLPVVYL